MVQSMLKYQLATITWASTFPAMALARIYKRLCRTVLLESFLTVNLTAFTLNQQYLETPQHFIIMNFIHP